MAWFNQGDTSAGWFGPSAQSIGWFDNDLLEPTAGGGGGVPATFLGGLSKARIRGLSVNKITATPDGAGGYFITEANTVSDNPPDSVNYESYEY